MPYVGEYIDKYRLIEELGGGAFGRVFLAEHIRLRQRHVAVKFLRADRIDNLEERERFLKEADLLDRLSHPSILTIIDVDLHDDIPYMITEYASGGTLRDYLKRRAQQPVNFAEAMRIIQPIGQALQYAHTAFPYDTIVHRDLKPENILFNARNEPLLADFGIAMSIGPLTHSSAGGTGTFQYMAPEQHRGVISPQCDQYALACVLYELLTGKLWFSQLLQTAPLLPSQVQRDLSSAVDKVLLRALDPERARRYPDIATFLEALQRAAQSNGPEMAGGPTGQFIQPEPRLHTPESGTRLVDPLAVPPSGGSQNEFATRNLPSRSTPGIITFTTDKRQTGMVPVPSLPETPTGRLEELPSPIMSEPPLPLTRKRRSKRAPFLLLAGLAVLTLGATILSLWQGVSLFASSARVTIIPHNSLVANTFILTGVAGNPDSAKRQVLTRAISATSDTQTATGHSTGSVEATVARGKLSIQNVTAEDRTISGKVVIQGNSGVDITFSGPLLIPAVTTVQVDAVAVNPGTAGNIPAGDISAKQCCGSSGILANNTQPFTGGQNDQPDRKVLQSDIDAAAATLENSLKQGALNNLQKEQINSNERPIESSLLCVPTVTPDHQVGDAPVSTFHVSVKEICHEEVYDAGGVQSEVRTLLINQAQADPTLKTHYVLVGQIQFAVLSATVSATDQALNLTVRAQGLWVYQFSAQDMQALKQRLVGLSKSAAQNLLKQNANLDQAEIQISGGDTMPADANKITIAVQNLSGAAPITPGTSTSNDITPVSTPTTIMGGS